LSHTKAHTLVNAKALWNISNGPTTESSIDEHYENWTFPRRGQEEPVNIQVYYPVLVLQGELFQALRRRNRLIIRRAEHIQYRKQLWSVNRKDSYQLDVVTLGHLPRYLNLVDQEIDTLKRRLQRHQSVVRESISRLIGNAHRVRRKRVNWRELFGP